MMTQFDLDPLSATNMDTPKPLVREARPEDLTQLTDLLASSFYGQSGWMRWVYPLVKLGIQEDLKQRLNSRKPYYVCLAALATDTGKVTTVSPNRKFVAGTVELSKRYAWPWQALSTHHLDLSNLAVRSDLRRRGIALALLTTCERIALQWRIYDLYLHVTEDNFEARQLYLKAGFQLSQAEDSLVTWLGQPRRLLMHKPLSKE